MAAGGRLNHFRGCQGAFQKKACLSIVEAFVQSCPKPCRRKGRSIACCIPQGATVVCARSVVPVREHGKLVTCLREGRERRWRLFSRASDRKNPAIPQTLDK